ncbi:MAG: ribosomal protein L7/L12 [Bacteroidales bacterium]|nr:ribosomal protein L7/L12 [Bacteroidales bacterium]
MNNKSNWDAAAFFERLTANNHLAQQNGFIFCRVSGLEGFEQAIDAMQSASAFLCVSDVANGYTELNNTPRTRRIKTVFLAMRHAIDDMEARQECMDIMRELFRQMMSRLNLEKTRIEQNCIYIDPRITFNEIDRYFFSGCACAYFQIAVDVFTDLRYSNTEWKDAPKELWLLTRGTDIMSVLKLVRELFGFGLKEANELVQALPGMLSKDFPENEFEAMKAQFEKYGARVELR